MAGKSLSRGYEKERAMRSPQPPVAERQHKLVEIFMTEVDPRRKQERFDALLAQQSPNSIANCSPIPKNVYFKDVKSVILSPFSYTTEVTPHYMGEEGEGDE